MSVKKIAAVFAAAAIIGSATYSLTDNFILDDVVMVSAASSLRRNSTGSEVTKLQKNLIKLNYLKSGSATGKYGSATEAAVKQFQTDYQLYADGIAGAKTLNLIASIINGTLPKRGRSMLGKGRIPRATVQSGTRSAQSSAPAMFAPIMSVSFPKPTIPLPIRQASKASSG